MKTRPQLSITEKQFQNLPEAKTTDAGSHNTVKAQFVDADGITKTGYFKRCDASYPPLLAKYAVAFSVFIRLALGKRAAEERLVYNDKNEVIGTISLEVPGFKHFSAPDKETLVKENIAELLVSAWRHQDDDRHPDNISLAGIIDFDMTYYRLTSIIKGPRMTSGYVARSPQEACKLTADQIRDFPEVPRNHWPSHWPKNLNLLKAYTYQEMDLINSLKGDTRFKKQTYAALLKEMLAFNPDMLRKRLQLYLGKEALNLHELPSSINQGLLSFNKNLFLDGSNQEYSFIDHCMMYFEQEHRDFIAVVNYMPEFRKFLIEEPDEFTNIKKWLVAQNDEIDAQQKKDQLPAFPYDLECVEDTYLRVWRDSFVMKFYSDIRYFETMRDKLAKQEDATFVELDAVDEEEFEEIPDLDAANSLLVISSLPKIPVTTVTANTDPFIVARTALVSQYMALYNKLKEKAIAYYKKKSVTIADNKVFFAEINALLDEHEKETLRIVGTDEVTEPLRAMIKADKGVNLFRKTLQLFVREVTDEYIFVAVADCKEDSSCDASPVLPNMVSYDQPKVAKNLVDLLCDWIITFDRSTLDSIVQTVLTDNYKTVGNVLFGIFNAENPLNRKTEILKLMENTSLTSTDLVSQIFSNEGRGWYRSSYNTNLLKELCLTMLKSYKQNSSKLLEICLSGGIEDFDKFIGMLDTEFSWHELGKNMAEAIVSKFKKAPIVAEEKGGSLVKPVSAESKKSLIQSLSLLRVAPTQGAAITKDQPDLAVSPVLRFAAGGSDTQ